jgi:hypothetical protein
MKAAFLGLSLMLIASGVRGGDSQGPVTEPKVDVLSGTWEPDQTALERLQGKAGTPRMRELVLRRNGTFLLQGIPVEWIATLPGKMPTGRYEGAGKWRWIRNGEKWEILLQLANASLVLKLRGEPSASDIVIPSVDAKGSFETVVHRTSLHE